MGETPLAGAGQRRADALGRILGIARRGGAAPQCTLVSKSSTGAERLRSAILNARQPALLPFFTAGHPRREDFHAILDMLAAAGDAVEIGVPFSDPMADGVTIQRASETALANRVSLNWILDELQAHGDPGVPLVLMSYYNPLLAYGLESLAARCGECGVAGLIVPDLPWEECAAARAPLQKHGAALVQMVTPATPDDRLRALCQASGGFVYAVTATGVTGGEREVSAEMTGYMQKVSEYSGLPVCAGFGVRSAQQVRALSGVADGVIVGSAVVDCLERGEDAGAFLRQLRD